MATNTGGTGEQQVIKGQFGEGDTHLGLAGNHGDVILGEDLTQQLLHYFSGARGGFAHLDHRPVAGRQRGDQRPDSQKQGVVPRHDNADHAQRLVDDLRLGRLEGQPDLAA